MTFTKSSDHKSDGNQKQKIMSNTNVDNRYNRSSSYLGISIVPVIVAGVSQKLTKSSQLGHWNALGHVQPYSDYMA